VGIVHTFDAVLGELCRRMVNMVLSALIGQIIPLRNDRLR
jgi:hypothetical protein